MLGFLKLLTSLLEKDDIAPNKIKTKITYVFRDKAI